MRSKRCRKDSQGAVAPPIVVPDVGRADPRNSTLKALLAHNAVDLGNPGPDYQSGYGSVRIKDTIDFMREGNFLEAQIDHGESIGFVINAGSGALKITLAWDDAPGTPNVIPSLVNDLDLVVVDLLGATQFPWTLDPANPSAPAVRTQADHVNNIEQVIVEFPSVGLWRAVVTGFNVPQGPQTFSICASSELIPDCNLNGIPDDQDITQGTTSDCNGNGIPDVCEPGCNSNGIPDECEIDENSPAPGGTFFCDPANPPPPLTECDPDCNGNGVPDECDYLPPEFPIASEHQAKKHRYLSIGVTTNCANEIAWKVRLVQLRRCAGDLERACVEDNDCDFGAGGPCIEHPDVGSVWWVQAPQEEPLGCIPGPCGPTDRFARVEARPEDIPAVQDFRVWTDTTLHVGDCEIVPIATYEIRACLPPDGSVCGNPLTIGTIRQPFISPGFRGNYGDIAGPVDPVSLDFSPPDGITSIVDVSAYQLTVQNYGVIPFKLPQVHPTWVDMTGLGDGTPPNYLVTVPDLVQILFALQGKKWTDTPNQFNPADCP